MITLSPLTLTNTTGTLALTKGGRSYVNHILHANTLSTYRNTSSRKAQILSKTAEREVKCGLGCVDSEC